LPRFRRESIEIVAQTKQPEEVEEFSKETQELITEEAKLAPIQQLIDEAVNPDMEMKRERSTPLAQAASPIRRVRIVTKVAPLKVRATPDARSKVLAQIPKNTIVLVFQEAKDWFQVEYQKGKKGWISKKFSQLVN
jgi:uncharacterized protein YgiM (DUF1202 family)